MTEERPKASPAVESPTDDCAPTGGSSRAGDEPLDAIVYDVHPALLPRAAHLPYDPLDYPYGPPSAVSAANSEPLPAVLAWIIDAIAWLVRAADSYITAIQRPPDFVVPKTFGMSAILGLITALAVLFALLRRVDAWPVFYFFFSVQAIAICVAQMLYGKTPRLASIIAGAVILPAFTMGMALLTNNGSAGILCLTLAFIPFGALLGYLTGTCAAGIFLVMDYLEPYLQGSLYSLFTKSKANLS